MITRDDVKLALAENGYVQGKPNDDPELDATHIWYWGSSKFAILSIPEDGHLVYGEMDGTGGEPGVRLEYSRFLLYLSGLMTLHQAERGNALPPSVAKKLSALLQAHQSAALEAHEDDD